jgi:hypothetical protein
MWTEADVQEGTPSRLADGQTIHSEGAGGGRRGRRGDTERSSGMEETSMPVRRKKKGE